MLELYVLSHSGKVPSDPAAVVFSDAGGTIGRNPGNTFVLPDPERHVSRVQARVSKLANGQYQIENVGTANSIFVGSVEVEPQTQAAFKVGDELRIGLYVLGSRLQSAKDASAREAQEAILVKTDTANVASAFDGLITQPVPAKTSSVETRVEPKPTSTFAVQPEIKADIKPDVKPNIKLVERPEPMVDRKFEPKPEPKAVRDPMVNPTATRIPDDFDPFAMPSAASRNTDNPLEELRRSDVSLRGMFEQTTKVDALIDPGTPTSRHMDIDPLFDRSPSALSNTGVDPLQLFGGSGDSLIQSALGPASNMSVSNHASELASFLNLPKPTRTESVPVKSDSSGLGIDLGGDFTPKIVPASTRSESVDPLQILPDDRSLITGQSIILDTINAPPSSPPEKLAVPIADIDVAMTAVARTGVPGERAIPVDPASLKAATTLVPAVMKEQARPSVENESVDTASLASNAALLRALLEGAGVPDLDFPQTLDIETMRKVGMLLQICIGGSVDMMQARAATKRELRADVTMIVSKGNNPLKFAPDGQAAMMQLLGRPFPGFMPPVDAVRDAFHDLRAHEIGVLAGTRAALKEVFERFNPDQLEARLAAPSTLQSLVPSTRKAKLWSLYTEMFRKIADEAEDDFQTLFGKAFRDAYETEVERIQNARHS
jgi:FHA domain-containing protein